MKNLLKQLIKAETTAEKGELPAAELFYEYFSQASMDVQVETWGSGRANITALLNGPKEGKTIIFLCHLDIVGTGEEKWGYEPFSGIENSGRFYGRGAVDMKGPAAAAAAAIRSIAESNIKLNGNIIFSATAGEETDSCGVKRFVRNFEDKIKTAAGVVVCEPTDFKVITSHRGILWLEIETRGKTAHGSTPDLGINAISLMTDLLERLKDYKTSFENNNSAKGCSMSINRIIAGKEINVIPDKCSIAIDFRTVPEKKHCDIISDFERMFLDLKEKNPDFKADLKTAKDVSALKDDTGCGFVKDFCRSVDADKTGTCGFGTDGPFLAELGLPIVIYGPGDPKLCHKTDEYIEISDLEKAVDSYKKIIMQLLTE